MNSFVKKAQDIGTTTVTENGDKTYSSSLNACVDLFFQVGAIRAAPDARINQLFAAAYGEDPELAVRIALYARDVRGGQGERRVFRVILKWLADYYPGHADRIMHLVPEVGRWDDLFILLANSILKNDTLELWAAALQEKNGLAAKWTPRLNKSQREFGQMIRKYLGLEPQPFQKLIAALTRVVETQMCNREWGAINYEHVPSVASLRYGKAFKRHDTERYTKYLEAVRSGEKKINAGALYPYDLINRVNSDPVLADTMWKALPDFIKDGMAFFPIVDVSGSMDSRISPKSNVSCVDVAVSLGIYCAERNKSAFKNLFMIFSREAQILTVPNSDLRSKVRYVLGRRPADNTNLDAAMQLIIKVAVDGRVPQADMPTHLLVMSDMEFDNGGGGFYNVKTRQYEKTSVSERTEELFKNAGYNVPNIVWWNIQSRNGSTPVRAHASGAALVSGCSPSIMKSLLNDEMTPVAQMLKTVNIERYNH